MYLRQELLGFLLFLFFLVGAVLCHVPAVALAYRGDRGNAAELLDCVGDAADTGEKILLKLGFLVAGVSGAPFLNYLAVAAVCVLNRGLQDMYTSFIAWSPIWRTSSM